jgi:hypothetical protein
MISKTKSYFDGSKKKHKSDEPKQQKNLLTCLYGYNLSDSILFAICLLPNYMVDILSPFTPPWESKKKTQTLIFNYKLQGAQLLGPNIAERNLPKNFGDIWHSRRYWDFWQYGDRNKTVGQK